MADDAQVVSDYKSGATFSQNADKARAAGDTSTGRFSQDADKARAVADAARARMQQKQASATRIQSRR